MNNNLLIDINKYASHPPPTALGHAIEYKLVEEDQ